MGCPWEQRRHWWQKHTFCSAYSEDNSRTNIAGTRWLILLKTNHPLLQSSICVWSQWSILCMSGYVIVPAPSGNIHHMLWLLFMLCMPNIKTLRSFTSFFPRPWRYPKHLKARPGGLLSIMWLAWASITLDTESWQPTRSTKWMWQDVTRTQSSLSLFPPSPSLLARRKPNLLKLIKSD